MLQIKVVQCKSEVLVHLAFEALYNTGGAGAAAAIVGEPEPGVFGFFEDVLVLGALYGYAPALRPCAEKLPCGSSPCLSYWPLCVPDCSSTSEWDQFRTSLLADPHPAQRPGDPSHLPDRSSPVIRM